MKNKIEVDTLHPLFEEFCETKKKRPWKLLAGIVNYLKIIFSLFGIYDFDSVFILALWRCLMEALGV